MTLAENRSDDAADRQPGRRGWAAVWAIMAGIFAIVTAEILPIGLLLPIADDFALSTGVSGWMMTIPGFVAALAAPAVTVLTARADRRTMLIVWIAALAASNLMCALATHFWVILAARVLVGIVIGGFWSIGAGLSGRLVTAPQVARATSTIFLAVPLGSVLGVPIGTFIAELAGWRMAFVVLAFLTGVVFVALLATLPALPPMQPTRTSLLAELLRRRRVRIGVTITVLVVLAHFGTYTYVSAFLEQSTGVGLGAVSALLLVYGAAGLVGNLAAGAALQRSLAATFGAAAALIAVATLLLPLVGHHLFGAVVLLVTWGLGYGAVPACSQTWLARNARGAEEAATVLFTSSFQATISVGALLGGLVVDATSPSTLLFAGATVAVAAVATLRALHDAED